MTMGARLAITLLTSEFQRERVTGIEPALSAWEADVLPLNYTRAVSGTDRSDGAPKLAPTSYRTGADARRVRPTVDMKARARTFQQTEGVTYRVGRSISKVGLTATQQRPSNSPFLAPSRNACHSAAVYLRIGPPGSLESRMATMPSAGATSTHAFAGWLALALRQANLTSGRSGGGFKAILFVSQIRHADRKSRVSVRNR
jgi:hypothetical protein